MRIAILDDYQDAARGLACFGRLEGHEVEVFRDTLTDVDAIAKRLDGFDAVVAIRERTRFTREQIERLSPRLRLISLTGPLSGHVDMAAAGARGITVCQGRGSGASAPELTWALVLAATRHIALEDRRLREGRWQTTIGRVLSGLTLGILGYGRIGAKVAGYGRAFGMDVLVHGREGSRERAARDGHALAASQAELFERSDVLSIHLSMNDGTRHSVRAGDLACMKPDALLVNTARAGLIEPGALLAALRAGRPGMAALDVFDVEPLPADDPLLALDNVLLAPHLGYVTRDGYEVLFGDAFDNLLAFAAGRPINVIAPPGAQGETRA
ncbi:MAG: D-2-hydroxyacid dehydrogenase family protein [Burkholderiales bacterium]|nr:MAG: D-2-hydroxyacid dehydrogenase family protein [Burkholderiales bacterium]